MTYVNRFLQKNIEDSLFKGKIIIVYGARQVGKTTLVKKILEKFKENNNKSGLYLNCEIFSVQEVLMKAEPDVIKNFIGDHKLIVLDEAQRIENIGVTLKVMIDTYPDIQIIATGSSSFDLANKINEPLTGRAERYILYPFSTGEILQNYELLELNAKLDNILRFGLYPEVFFLPDDDAKKLLDEIGSNYLYKDILNFEEIKKSRVLVNLLQLLALQMGNEVSYSELALNLGINRLTVQKYMDILEQAFIIYRLTAFSRNIRKEISKSIKVYFFDTGIRNSLIQNFNQLNLRNDTGALWENFCIMERLKYCSTHGIRANRYFWRTYDQKEIDYIEEREGRLFTYEFKWSDQKGKIPLEFLKTYPNSEFQIINRENVFNVKNFVIN